MRSAASSEHSLLSAEALAAFLDRWNSIQTDFVYEPDMAVLEAEDLVKEILEALADETAKRQRDLAAVGDRRSHAPEELWLTVQRCQSVVRVIQTDFGTP